MIPLQNDHVRVEQRGQYLKKVRVLSLNLLLFIALMPLERTLNSASPRKSYQRSHNGCRNCKIRRVKCDEGRPICGACLRRREACTRADVRDQLSLVLTSAAAIASLADSQLELPILGEFRKIDLELLHHWTTTTLQTFVPDLPVTRHGFQVRLPQLALQNDFLLHSIFALSSLHIHVLRRSEDYLQIAKVHCQKAIITLNPASDHVSWELAFMANALISIYWLASPQGGTLDLFDWFPAARTFMRRLKTYWIAVSNGVVRDSFIDGLTKGPQNPMPSPFPTIVENIYREDVCPYDTEELTDFNVVRAYELLVQKLSYTWNLLMHPNLQNVAIYLFPAGALDNFIDLFLKKRPRALILVAHYCALLTRFGSVWWYGTDRARKDIERILSLLDAKWLPWMGYPLKVIGRMESSSVKILSGHTSGSGSSVGSWECPNLLSPVVHSSHQDTTAPWTPSDFYPTMTTTPYIHDHSRSDAPTANESKSFEANIDEDTRAFNLTMLALSSF
ncbi:hypothetical protein DL96DRAFT_858317 [Flagelloscypha sp. PMI_526]|nr:hypothetical protein DL96DRAFT_858317 [Flagelloscypha sp. PMI_526]